MKRKELTHSEDPIRGASSSLTSPQVGDNEGGTKRPKGNEYEVFLSFRGKDTRKGFTDYLYTSLVDAGIYVFRDDNELRVGEEIGPELLYNITQSKISIPIISEDYASSKWCLRELAQILKCRRSKGQVVLPIFYKVEPSQVRHLTERFGDAINEHKKNLDQMVVKEWEDALREVTSLKGWESEKIDNGHEAVLVKMVIRRVTGELKRLFQLNVPKQFVGIDDRIEQIMSKIDFKFNGTWIIGIYGMGGVGKTTLAKVLYNKLSSSSYFEDHSFLAEIRERSQREGIKCLQKQLIYNIMGSSYDVFDVDDGINVLKSRFTNKKVLIVLDDIIDNTQLNALVGEGNWFKAGSIVIITTRDKSILDNARASHTYEVKELLLDQSLILFSRHAFRKDYPPSDYKVISHEVISTTGGLPLALEVIGSFLCGKTMEAWKDTSKKLKKGPHKKVQDMLGISYEALDYEEQQIFLDIACFFIGSCKQSPTYMWDACGFFPRKGIEVLSLLSLIKVDEDGTLMMHDQLRDFGREIVRQENLKEPQKRSRLWDYEEAEDVLDGNKGTSKIEGLRLGYGHGKSYQGEQFNKLTNLRFLQICDVNFIGDFQNLLPRLRWLEWNNCPSDFEMVNFHPKKLVVLDLSQSRISEKWGGWGPLQLATELKVLKLSFCECLRRTPDLSAFKSLEFLILKACFNLEEIHPSIWYIKTLVCLNVNSCWRLKELPARVVSRRTEESRDTTRKCLPLMPMVHMEESRDTTRIFLPLMPELRMEESRDTTRKCLPLMPELRMEELRDTIRKSFTLKPKLSPLYEAIVPPESIESFTQLELCGTRIARLPEFIGSMKGIETLNASSCGSLAHIPNSIGNLTSLSLLNLMRCHSLREIPDSIGKLTSLTELRLACTSITKLPESIGNLQNLRILDIDETLVVEMPSAIGMLAKLQVLSASHCENLEGLPSSIGELVSLNKLHLDRSGILGLPESISKLSSLQNLSVQFCKNLRELPEPPSSLTALHVTFPSPSLSYLSKLTLLKELTLFDCRPLECLPVLPIGLSKVSFPIRMWTTDWLNNEDLSELICNKSFGLRKVTRILLPPSFICYCID